MMYLLKLLLSLIFLSAMKKISSFVWELKVLKPEERA